MHQTKRKGVVTVNCGCCGVEVDEDVAKYCVVCDKYYCADCAEHEAHTEEVLPSEY